MDNNTLISHRKRGMVFLAVAVVMLVLGETLLRQSLTKLAFVLYWLVCLVCTALAILFAFLDVNGIQRQAREQQRELLEKTIQQIARQKQEKTRRAKPDH